MTDIQKQTLYLYDLPKESVTSVKIQNVVKLQTGYDLPDMPQIRRDLNKPFYTAMIRINDANTFNEIKSKLKYFKLDNNDCRALPFLKELTAAYRGQNNKTNNVFVKGIDKSMTTEQLDQKVAGALGDHIVSAKVSINTDRSSRGYGFVCLDSPELVN